MSRRVPMAIAAALAIVLAGVVVTLSQRAPRLAGSNAQIERSGLQVVVPPGGLYRCQDGDMVPGDTGGVRLFLNGFGRTVGPLEVTLATGGRPGEPPRVVSRANLPYPLTTGSYVVPVAPRVRRGVVPARVCFVNRGRDPVALAGNRTPGLGSGANPYARRLDDDARLDYVYRSPRSWWSMAGTIAGRFGLVKTSFFGTWTMWAVFGVLALLWASVIALLLRVLPRS